MQIVISPYWIRSSRAANVVATSQTIKDAIKNKVSPARVESWTKTPAAAKLWSEYKSHQSI